jgi:hypothetical protein
MVIGMAVLAVSGCAEDDSFPGTEGNAGARGLAGDSAASGRNGAAGSSHRAGSTGHSVTDDHTGGAGGAGTVLEGSGGREAPDTDTTGWAGAGGIESVAGAGGAPDARVTSRAGSGGIEADAGVGGAPATDTQARLLEALQAIRVESTSCDLSIPVPEGGEQLDFGKLNVNFVRSDPAATPERLHRDDTCSGAGWHYDDPSAPTKIILCPATCTAVQTDAKGRLELELGCATRVLFR